MFLKLWLFVSTPLYAGNLKIKFVFCFVKRFKKKSEYLSKIRNKSVYDWNILSNRETLKKL